MSVNPSRDVSLGHSMGYQDADWFYKHHLDVMTNKLIEPASVLLYDIQRALDNPTNSISVGYLEGFKKREQEAWDNKEITQEKDMILATIIKNREKSQT